MSERIKREIRKGLKRKPKHTDKEVGLALTNWNKAVTQLKKERGFKKFYFRTPLKDIAKRTWEITKKSKRYKELKKKK